MGALDPEAASLADISARLRLTRQAMGWSQAELSRRTGISRQSWNNAETGDERISVDNAIKLCRVTGVTLDWIYRGMRWILPTEVAREIARREQNGGKPRRGPSSRA